MTGHVDTHNDIRARVLTQGARYGVAAQLGGPFDVGDPAHISEHSKLVKAMKLIAQAAAVELVLPADHRLGDTGHVTDHATIETALEQLEKAEPPKVTIAHSGHMRYTITDYKPALAYKLRIESGSATILADTISFSTESGRVAVQLGGQDLVILEVRKYSYHTEHVDYQTCYNPCGNCRTDVNPHSWGCGCGSPCGDSGGGQWGDCICRGPGYDVQVKDPTPAGFVDEFDEWSQIAPPGTPRALTTPQTTIEGDRLDLWLEVEDYSSSELYLLDGPKLVAVFATYADAPQLRFAELSGRKWMRVEASGPWVKPGLITDLRKVKI